jgi:hypothetical protein
MATYLDPMLMSHMAVLISLGHLGRAELQLVEIKFGTAYFKFKDETLLEAELCRVGFGRDEHPFDYVSLLRRIANRRERGLVVDEEMRALFRCRRAEIPPQEISDEGLHSELETCRLALETPGYFGQFGDDAERLQQACYHLAQSLEAEIELRDWPEVIGEGVRANADEEIGGEP